MEPGNRSIRRPPDVFASEDFRANDPWWSRHLLVFLAGFAVNYGRFAARLDQLGLKLTTVTKSALRKILRATRKEHVAAQADAVRALLFNRPPRTLTAHIEAQATIGLYHAAGSEAPAAGYARFFAEEGHRIALPYFASPDAPMAFREHTDPFSQSDLTTGAFGIKQPEESARELTPDIVFVPLIAFTAAGDRLGQGGGHYDRWLAEHPTAMTIGMAWDVQLVEHLPTEPHDVTLDAVVTPTRLYGLD